MDYHSIITWANLTSALRRSGGVSRQIFHHPRTRFLHVSEAEAVQDSFICTESHPVRRGGEPTALSQQSNDIPWWPSMVVLHSRSRLAISGIELGKSCRGRARKIVDKLQIIFRSAFPEDGLVWGNAARR